MSKSPISSGNATSDPQIPTGQVRCIYCPSVFDPMQGEGDHVLPRGFGDFENAILFRGVCRACNNKLSQLEEELLRTAPEAVYRRMAGAGRNRRGQPVRWQGASGVPPPQFEIAHSDHGELVDADPQVPGQSTPVNQLVVFRNDGQSFTIRLFPGMNANALQRKLEQQGIAAGDVSHAYWHVDEEHADIFTSTIKEVFPDSHHDEYPPTPAGSNQVPVRIACRFTGKYYRAIAKVAFHYFLSQSRCGFTGHEDYFAPVRKFMMEGGDHKPFFESQKLTIPLPIGRVPGGGAMLSARWMHMLCCSESPATVVVAVYTIFGPKRLPSPHNVTLLHRPSSLYLPQHKYAHGYFYGNPALGDTREAFVEPIEVFD
jgi:hypothetical protein